MTEPAVGASTWALGSQECSGQIGTLMAGSIITETIYAWPGVGRLLINSIFHRDAPVVEAAVFFIATAIAVANLAVDVLQMLIDPRIRRA